MDNYSVTQAFTAAVAVLLGLIFYILLVTNSAIQYKEYQTFLTPLLLIINAIILLAIFSQAAKISHRLERKR